jgi:L-Ala-D/L-Glu epimerase
MKMEVLRLVHRLNHPFTIARGTLTEQTSLVVRLEWNDRVGLGEVTENSYYGHSYEAMAAAIKRLGDDWADLVAAEQYDWQRLFAAVGGDSFAASAVDMAIVDLRARLRQQPVWAYWDLHWNEQIVSSYTIGIDTIDKMVAKLKEQPDWPVYKIKLGTEHDLEIVQRLRQATTARFRVDANCGWQTEEAIEKSKALADLGVEFIEQPLAPELPSHEHRRVFLESALPIIADESCQVPADVARCADFFHGINVKVCKCGGLTPALAMLREARALGMQTMVGCMIEGTIGIGGAAQLAPLLDYVDLDGANLIANDFASGIRVEHGRIVGYGQPGTGVVTFSAP